VPCFYLLLEGVKERRLVRRINVAVGE